MAETALIESADYPAAGDRGSYSGKPTRRPLETLNEFLTTPNVAELLDDDELGEIGRTVKFEHEIDKNSRREWETDYHAAMKLALQQSTPKNYPWKGAANVKYPLLTSAAMQFAARAYPAIVRDHNPVKARVVGKDDDGQKRNRGDRIGRHMSWQLMEEMTEWEGDTDQLLHILPIAGMCYRKSYFDPTLGRNVSEMVHPLDLVINDGAKDINTVPRITQRVPLYPYEIEERMRSGVFRRAELGLAAEGGTDKDAPHIFLEQHRKLDLDDDGYGEPYIVTVHESTSQVVRIVPNFREQSVAVNEAGEVAKITRDQYFTKYGFMPNPSGGWHDIGFGYLLRPINEATNTVINQLLDAGHLATVGGGFIGSGARLKGGQLKFKIGEWIPVDVPGGSLRDNLVPRPIQEPSLVLFQLLGLLIDAGKDISSVKDVMTGGENQGKNASPTTTLALIEQGMQVFTAIYKRVFRALKSEYTKLYALNGIYLDEETYFTVLDTPEKIGKEDYAPGDFDVVPVADPNMVTNMQRLGRAEYLAQFVQDPHFDGMEIRRRMLEAASINDIDELLVKELPDDPSLAAKADELDIQKRKLEIEWYETQSKVAERKAKILKLVAEAEGIEAGPQLDLYKQELAFLEDMAKEERARVDERAVSGVEGKAGDQAVSQVPAGAA